jgi:O-antigen ligase
VDTWLLFSFVAFLAVAGLIANYAQYQKAVRTLAIALLVFNVIAIVFGTMDNGRLFLPNGKFANPNEMAQALLIGLPLWGAIMLNAKTFPGKAASFFVTILMLGTTFRTGSRGAMIAFVAMFLVLFLRATVIAKVRMILVGVLFAGILVTTMPGNLIARYKTITDEEVDDGEMDAGMKDSAISSSESRKRLLRTSLIFTIRHPIFGVGPGMFAVADDDYSKANGLRKGQWLGTHNSYTQVSSELGIPAAIFFIAAIFMSLKGTYDVYKKTRGDPRLAVMGNMALGLHYCLIIYAVTILFEHIAYTVMLPVLGGLAAALIRTADSEIERIKAQSAPVALSPAAFQTYLGSRTIAAQGGARRPSPGMI